jgi:hypothetical protein
MPTRALPVRPNWNGAELNSNLFKGLLKARSSAEISLGAILAGWPVG